MKLILWKRSGLILYVEIVPGDRYVISKIQIENLKVGLYGFKVFCVYNRKYVIIINWYQADFRLL